MKPTVRFNKSDGNWEMRSNRVPGIWVRLQYEDPDHPEEAIWEAARRHGYLDNEWGVEEDGRETQQDKVSL